MNKSNRYRMVILFMTLFIVMVGFGVIMPILPFYAASMGATALHLGLLFASYSIVQFFFAPIWGDVSDRIGRKPVILIGLLGFGFSFIFFGFATSLWMLFAARLLGGMLSAATLPTVMAYVADTTDSESRGSGLAMMGAAMGMGMVFGPVIGGFLGERSPSLPFFFSGTLSLVVLVFALVLLPESRTAEARSHAQSQRRSNSLRDIVGELSGPIGFLLVIAFVAMFATANLEATFALFSQQHLGFSEGEMGMIFGAMGLSMALTQALFVGRFISRWGEQRVMQLGLLSSALGFLLILFTWNLASVLVVMVLFGFGGAALNPSVNSLASKLTPAGRQGRTMGVIGSYNSLGRIFGPVVGGLLFDVMGYRWPYIFGTLLFGGIYLLSFGLFKRNRQAITSAQAASRVLAESAAGEM